MKRSVIPGMIFGAVLGFATSAVAQLLHGVSIEQWLRLAPAAQEIYVAGMLDAMGGLNIKGAVYAHYDLKRSAKCIRKNSINAQQLAQGMANYAKLKPGKIQHRHSRVASTFLARWNDFIFRVCLPRFVQRGSR